MNRILVLATTLVLAAGCRREAPAPAPAAPAAAEAERPSAAPPASAPPAAAPASDAFDAGAFSGTYAAGRTRLEIHGEGTYGLDDAGSITSGSWTHEPGNTVRLDPASKGAEDRVYRIDGPDAIVLLDASGRPVGAPLRRQPTP